MEARKQPKPYNHKVFRKNIALQYSIQDIIHLLIHVHTFYLVIKTNNKVLFFEGAEGEGAFFEARKACEKKVRRPVKRDRVRSKQLITQTLNSVQWPEYTTSPSDNPSLW